MEPFQGLHCSQDINGTERKVVMIKLKKIAISALTMAFIIGNATSAFAAGWVHTNEGWKYQWGSGEYCYNNWVNYKNHWFYFGNDQIMRTGWIQKDGTWYFAADSGELQAGILKINGNAYYMDGNSCKLVTGDRRIDGELYNFSENGTTNGSPYIYTEWNSNGTIKQGVKFGVR